MSQKSSRRSFLGQTAGLGLFAGLSPLIKGCTTKQDLDLVITGGEVFDGTGAPAVQTDLGILRGRIREMGKLNPKRGRRVILAHGLSVCPGFIDVHNHTDDTLLVEPRAQSMVRQGVTTLIAGNCGWSPFPFAREKVEEIKADLWERYRIDLDWEDIQGFFARLQEKGLALNYATLVGQGSIRGAVVGLDDRPATPAQMEKMKRMVAQNMQHGAVGLSTGLGYAPGSFADGDELAELAKVAARFGGVYATHLRDESDHLLEAIDEAVEIARRAKISLQISHFKVAYPRNWGKIDQALARIDRAAAEGIDVHCDRYPYTASSTGLAAYFPAWARQGNAADFLARLRDPALEPRLREHLKKREEKLGSWDKVRISFVVTRANRRFLGKSILRAARESEKQPYDFIRDLLIEEKRRVGMVCHTMKEENLRRILAHPRVGIGSDGYALAPYGPLGEGKPHPRSYGTFPRALGRYVRDEKIESFPKMLRKVTSLPARKFKLSGRGVLKPGFFADLVLLNRRTLADRATFNAPHRYPVGIEHVLVNGRQVLRNAEHTGRLPGRILRRPHW